MAAGERTLILAEGFSGDAHYGKTMRGVLRYRGEDVVAVLDSTRDGGTAARPIQNPWSEGDNLMSQIADGWTGKPIWGRSRNTWIKFVARP